MINAGLEFLRNLFLSLVFPGTFSPFRGRRPPPCDVHWLDFDEPWTEAPELGPLCKVFAQDTFNLPKVQLGLKSAQHTHTTFASYQETKIRHFHTLLEKYIAA